MGTYDTDFQELRTLVSGSPQDAEDYLLRAHYFTAVHEFTKALADLEMAENHGAPSAKLNAGRRSIQLARGENLLELKHLQESRLEKRKSYEDYLILASIEGELGNFEASHDDFAKALEHYQDSSPFPVAYVYFQRGVMWAEKAGDETRATQDYLLATQYIPEFVMAQVHLSEILRETDKAEEAIRRLKKIVHSPDPEASGLLGEILVHRKKLVEGQKYINQARASYERLLQEYPLAFSDHGAEFFGGPGKDPDRALFLALQNLDNRKSQRAYQLSMQAALSAHDLVKLCELYSEVRTIGPGLFPLKNIVTLSSSHCHTPE